MAEKTWLYYFGLSILFRGLTFSGPGTAADREHTSPSSLLLFRIFLHVLFQNITVSSTVTPTRLQLDMEY